MEFPRLGLAYKVIIAMKGLPCTGKSEIASAIGEWAGCSVFSIDDFLSTVTMSLEKGYTSELMPSEEEAERLHSLAFDALCNSALRYLAYKGQCVVIKSRLCSTLELDCLLHLSRKLMRGDIGLLTIIIIIECHTKNEHRLCDRLEFIAERYPEHAKEWYKARSRLDFEKARDDWLNSQPNWDLHLSNLINADERSPRRVIRLVVDPFDDLNLTLYPISDLTPAFRDAIHYLVTTIVSGYYGAWKEDDCLGEEIIKDRYEVVRFHKLQRYLVEKELSEAYSRQKNKYLCPTSRDGKCCVFKTCTEEELHHHQAVGQGDDDDYNCGVCEERVVSEGYTCHFCFLTLHKSCTEHQGVSFQDLISLDFPEDIPSKYACKSCTEGGKDFSEECNSCLYQTHLKGGMLPTIIKHDCHWEHFLSFQVDMPSTSFECKACIGGLDIGRYGCSICGLYYCLVCVFRPGKMEHNHGGHKHVLELVYSRDGMEPEEDYWCGICYDDIDPQHWFYYCQNCPCYEVDPLCIDLSSE